MKYIRNNYNRGYLLKNLGKILLRLEHFKRNSAVIEIAFSILVINCFETISMSDHCSANFTDEDKNTAGSAERYSVESIVA